MKNATKLLATGVLAVALAGAAVASSVPEGKVAVIRATSIDGLARHDGQVTESFDTAYSFDGTTWNLEGVSSLDGVKTILLVDHREDSAADAGLVRKHSQDIRVFNSTQFTVQDVPGKTLTYQVASIAGNLRLLGGGDQILATGGDHGPYHVWKVEEVRLVDADAISLR